MICFFDRQTSQTCNRFCILGMPLYLHPQLTIMKSCLGFIVLILLTLSVGAQKMTIAQMKTELEKSPNSPLYAKDILKKRIKIDTITVTRIGAYSNLADSLAYSGKVKKVYGPYKIGGQQFLVQILAKAPNTFNRISQIFIDTSVFRYRFADSLGKSILTRINNGSSTFEQLAQTYSMGGESKTKGDLGWVAQGILMPQIEHEVAKRKKGEIFTAWTKNGLHIIKKTEDSKQDTGFALMLRIFL